jgi:hypothetical protein
MRSAAVPTENSMKKSNVKDNQKNRNIDLLASVALRLNEDVENSTHE